MLKIAMNKAGKEDRWTLHGQLSGPWVGELRTVWRNTQGADEHRRCVFDLNEVTFVDKAGEKLLRALAKQGVQFEASGIYVRGVLKQLEAKATVVTELMSRLPNQPQGLSANNKYDPGRITVSPTLVKTQNKRAPAVPILRARVDEDDAVLVDAAQNGDELAFETLVKRHRRRILAIAVRYTRTQHDAEDVFQESVQKAFVYLHKFEGKSAFSTWLTRIAINEALLFLRRGRSHREISMDQDFIDAEGAAARPEIPDVDPDPETSYLRREEARMLFAALKSLRPALRRAIELRELAELSTEETARRMGLSVAAVKARLFHGRRKLHQALRRYMRSPHMPGNDVSRIPDEARTSRKNRLSCAPSSLTQTGKALWGHLC